MKKFFSSLLLLFFGLLLFGTKNMSASQLQEKPTLIPNSYFEDNENYYILTPSPKKARTWSKTQGYTITNTKRTYLGRFKNEHSITIKIPLPFPGLKPIVIYKYSKSGFFKEYRQSITIRVTVKVYRKIDNRYLKTTTYTSHTSYIDKIPD